MNDNDRPQGERRDMDDLAEVIRMQAEALARITQRMADQRAPAPAPASERPIPPVKHPVDVLPVAPAGGSSNLPALADDPALSAESLPVLNAFKRFLEAERRRARRRLLVLTALFVLLLGSVLLAFLYLGRTHVERLDAALKAEREKVARVQDTTDSKLKNVVAEVKQAADVASGLRRDLTNTVLLTRSNLTAQLDSRDGELERLKDVVAALQIENATLANTLNALSTPAPVALPMPVEETPVLGPVAAEGTQGVSRPVMIKTSKSGNTVPFRLPASP